MSHSYLTLGNHFSFLPVAGRSGTTARNSNVVVCLPVAFDRTFFVNESGPMAKVIFGGQAESDLQW